MNKDMIAYYRDRAKEYERIYSKPERQDDIKAGADNLQRLFSGKEVFEIACGTGFWTEYIATTAKSVLATDINQTVLEIARAKSNGRKSLRYEVQDLYTYEPALKHESVFGGFIFSHVLKQNARDFFKRVNGLVQENGLVVLMDNNYVEGSNHPITETDKNGNTYQIRKLEDGSLHKVLKNFPSEVELKNQLAEFAQEIEFIQLKYFWILTYRAIIPNKT